MTTDPQQPTSARPPHRPGHGRPVPVSTYRLQLTPDFGFAAVGDLADYLARLGITHAYLSPVLSSGAGSEHGYDVTSHADLSEEKGGRAAFDAMLARLRASGIHVIADVVPNHMTVPTPMSRNAQFWSVLRFGRDSPHAHWFDIDWDAEGQHLLLPILGSPLDRVLARGELTLGAGGPDGQQPVLRYFEHEFPIRPGTHALPLPDLLEAQPFRLAHWKDGDDGLNYRRFFDVTSLAAIRVEEPDVFYRTHALLLDLIDTGAVDGLRIDHPDGLADPAGYLARIADSTGDSWVVVEKILEGGETLADSWRCCGTTGYDALLRVGGLFVDPEGADPLTRTYAAWTGTQVTAADIVHEAKTEVVTTVLAAEVNRLLRLLGWVLPDSPPEPNRRAVEALLVSMDRYRAYIDPGGSAAKPVSGPLSGPAAEPAPEAAAAREAQVLDEAAARAARLLDVEGRAALRDVVALAKGLPVEGMRPDTAKARRDLVVRFQQTCGPVMAKGIEDTAFYRYHRLVALNEVGGDPDLFGVGPEQFHAYCADRLTRWPVTMTTLSTHDTKRSEDVRARLAVLAERPAEWAHWVEAGRDLAAPRRDPLLDAETEYLLWQVVVGTWPITGDRLAGYATKAVREAKRHTSWVEPNDAYEAAVAGFVSVVTEDPAIVAHVSGWLDLTAGSVRANVLGQKLIQLTMPGVADVYQGTELVALSLVDPDNRRPIDYGMRGGWLDRLDAGERPRDLDEEKLLVTASALRLRRARPECFVGPEATYVPLTTTTPDAVAFARGTTGRPQTVTVASRLTHRRESRGGWADHTVTLPPGPWRDTLSGREFAADRREVRLADLLADLPVALLTLGQGAR